MITSPKELKGTCYVEVQPGCHTGSFWHDDSAYFTDETFGLFSQVISKFAPSYSIWGITEIVADTWQLIKEELKQLGQFLSSYPPIDEIEKHIAFVYEEDNKKAFINNQQELTAQLIETINMFTSWINDTCSTHLHITILGI